VVKSRIFDIDINNHREIAFETGGSAGAFLYDNILKVNFWLITKLLRNVE